MHHWTAEAQGWGHPRASPDWPCRLEVTLAQRNQPEIGPDQFSVRNTVALDYGAGGFGERPMPVQTVAHRGQAAVGCIDFGSGLLENESAREPKALTGCAMLLYPPKARYCRLWEGKDSVINQY